MAYKYGPLSMNYGLLYGIVTYYFGLLGFAGRAFIMNTAKEGPLIYGNHEMKAPWHLNRPARPGAESQGRLSHSADMRRENTTTYLIKESTLN